MKPSKTALLRTDQQNVRNDGKVKILHIIVGLNVGGAERFLCRLIESHQGSPHFNHHVISLMSKGILGVKLENMGVNVSPMGMRSLWHVPLVFYRVFKKIRLENPDVVQCWMYYADLIGGLSAKLAKTKVVLWGIRNSDFEAGGTPIKKLVRKLCAYLSYRIPDKIICVAQSALDVHKAVGYDPSRMEVVPNGYDISKLSFSPSSRKQIREELNLVTSDLVVGSVGRYCKAKDHASFIYAASRAATSNMNLRFILIGREITSENIELQRLIDATGMAKHFILLGERSNISEFMSAMDIFCLHSVTEGFPNVLGEAMCAGLPCITTDAGDAKYLLGDCGLVVPLHNRDALLVAILTMAQNDPAELLSMGQKARNRIASRFTLMKSVKSFEEVYLQGRG